MQNNFFISLLLINSLLINLHIFVKRVVLAEYRYIINNSQAIPLHITYRPQEVFKVSINVRMCTSSADVYFGCFLYVTFRNDKNDDQKIIFSVKDIEKNSNIAILDVGLNK
jgi:hypothetical protein